MELFNKIVRFYVQKGNTALKEHTIQLWSSTIQCMMKVITKAEKENGSIIFLIKWGKCDSYTCILQMNPPYDLIDSNLK